MEPGEFEGRIGRYHWESEPWWPDAGAGAGRARPNVLRRRARRRRLRPARLLRLRHRHADLRRAGRHRASGSPTSTPPRSARRRGRRCSPGATTTPCGMGRITDLATGFPGYDAPHPAVVRLPARDPRPGGLRRLGGREVAPDARGRGAQPPPAATVGPSAEGSSASTASSRARPTSSRRHSPATTTSSTRPAPRSPTATTSPRTSPTRPIRLSATSGPSTSTSRSSAGSRTGACHSPHQPPADWLERYRGRFDDGWDAWREATLARQVERGVVAARHPPLAPARLGAGLGRAVHRRAAPLRPVHGGLRRLPLPHRSLHRAPARRPRGDRRPRRTRSSWSSPTTAPAARAARTGSINDNRPWNFAGRPLGRGARPHRRDRRPDAPQQLPVGLDRRRQHAVPALEAGGARGRRRRPADRVLAGRHRGPAVRCGTSTCTPSTSLPRSSSVVGHRAARRPSAASSNARWTASSFRYAFDDAAAPERHTVQYYEMLGCRALYQDGWKAVTLPPHPGRRARASTGPSWELYDLRGPIRPSSTTSPPPSRRAWPRMVERWWQEAERNQVLPRRQPGLLRRACSSAPRPCRGRSRYEYRPGTAPVPEAVAVNVRNRSHIVTADVVVPDGGAEGVLIAQGSRLGGWTLFVAGRRLVYVHNRVGAEQHRIAAGRSSSRPDAHELPFRFARTGEHAGSGVPPRRRRRGRRGRHPPASHRPASRSPAPGWRADAMPACPSATTTSRRSPSTGELRLVVVEVDGEAFVDPEGEADVSIVTQ